MTSCFSALAAPLRPPPGPRIATSVLSVWWCVRGVDLPRTSAHRPWEGWGAATHARPAAAPRPVLKCASAQGGAGWRKRRRPFQGWKVLVKWFFGALKPRRPAPTPENVGPPPKLGPPPVPVTTTYVLPLYISYIYKENLGPAQLPHTATRGPSRGRQSRPQPSCHIVAERSGTAHLQGYQQGASERASAMDAHKQ